MKPLSILLAMVAALSSTACAGTSGAVRDAHDASAAQHLVSGADDVASLSPAPLPAPDETDAPSNAAMGVDESLEATFVDTPTPHLVDTFADTDGAATAADSDDSASDHREMPAAELDAEALYTDVVIRDPWEPYNRRISRFNGSVDRRVLRPLAVRYTKVVPVPVRSGVSRFFNNMGTPATAVNQLLQGRPGQAAQSLGRFTINTTIGIGGVFDPATRMGIPKHGGEDFGQTLAMWGWRDSRYLVLPLLGPATVRDSFSMVGDRLLSPSGYVSDTQTVAAIQLVDIIDIRAQLLPMDAAMREAYDEYALIRDAWAQRRKFQIEEIPQDGRN